MQLMFTFCCPLVCLVVKVPPFKLTQTPIAPHAADSHLEQDTKVSNAQWNKPAGRTLLDIATTYRSTIDSRLLEFDVRERIMCALTLQF